MEMQRTDRCGALLRELRARWRDQSGVTLAIMTAGMVMTLSAVALAVDVGMMMSARAEAQRTADLAALAGAGALAESPTNDAYAAQEATEYASTSLVRKDPVVLTPPDVTVDLAAQTVRVVVNRTANRGNPVGTFFARIFGVSAVDLVADATAQVSPAGGINCLLPLAVPDRWFEAGGPGNDPDDYNEEYGDEYIPWAEPGTDPPVFNDPYTGYAQSDIGTEIALIANGGGGSMNPSWYYPWRPPGQSGASDYRTNISGCVDPTVVYGINQVVDTEPGSMSGPTRQGFQDLIDLDPLASWNSVQNCVTDAGHSFSSDPSFCRSSVRVRPIPMFDPRVQPDPGNKPFTFTNFAGVFVDRIQGNTVYAKWTGYKGLAPPGPGAGVTAGPLFKVLRLIE